MMKVYHYTSERAAHIILETGQYDPIYSDMTGLISNRWFGGRLIHSVEGMDKPAWYGLLDPVDKDWSVREYFSGVDEPMFEAVIDDIKTFGYEEEIILLEIDIEEDDEVYVADHGFHLADDYKGCGAIHDSSNWQYDPGFIRCKSRYRDSLVPIDQYDHERDQYLLPEVIGFSDIPSKQIRAVDKMSKHELKTVFAKGVALHYNRNISLIRQKLIYISFWN